MEIEVVVERYKMLWKTGVLLPCFFYFSLFLYNNDSISHNRIWWSWSGLYELFSGFTSLKVNREWKSHNFMNRFYLTLLMRYSWPRRRWVRHRWGWGRWWRRPGGSGPCSWWCRPWSWPTLNTAGLDVCHSVSTLSLLSLKHVLYPEISSLIHYFRYSDIMHRCINSENQYLPMMTTTVTSGVVQSMSMTDKLFLDTELSRRVTLVLQKSVGTLWRRLWPDLSSFWPSPVQFRPAQT